jgi:hypothetical protein
MKTQWLALLLVMAAIPCLSQLDSKTLTVTATRTVIFQADQVVFLVVVGSGPSATLDQIVAALTGTGISSTDLVSVDDFSGRVDNRPFLEVPLIRPVGHDSGHDHQAQFAGREYRTDSEWADLEILSIRSTTVEPNSTNSAVSDGWLDRGRADAGAAPGRRRATESRPDPGRFRSTGNSGRRLRRFFFHRALRAVGSYDEVLRHRSVPNPPMNKSMWRLTLLVSVLAFPAFAQLDSNTMAVTAARSIAPSPDRILFAVSVTSGLSATLDQIVAALPGTGIAAADLYSVVASTQVTPPTVTWSLSTTVPLANIQTTIARFNALASSIGQNQSGLALIFSVQAAQSSPASLTCPVATLIADARAQAQKLADAAHANLGPIVGVADGVGGFLIEVASAQGHPRALSRR